MAHGGLVRYANANAAVEEPDLRDVQCARLDVHELARDGKLTLGKRGTLFGTVGFEVVGGPDAQQLVLEFPIKSASGERLDPVRQIISCYWRQAHYGGRYLMFLCSECGSPARVLYARYFSDRIWFFNCRSCVGITYQSTMGHRWDRSARRVEKLRARRQWSVGTAPIKPRGMHKRTYQRILGTFTYHEAIRKQARATPENAGQISTVLTCGGSAEAGLWGLVDGQSANLHLGSTQVCAGRSQDWIKVKNPDAPRQGDRGGMTPAHPVVA